MSTTTAEKKIDKATQLPQLKVSLNKHGLKVIKISDSRFLHQLYCNGYMDMTAGDNYVDNLLPVFKTRWRNGLSPESYRDSQTKDLYTQLYKLLEKELNSHERKALENARSGKVRFEELIHVIQEGQMMVFRQEGVPLCMKVTGAGMQRSMFGNFLNIQGVVYGWNGARVECATHRVRVGAYSGTRSLKELGVAELTAEEQTSLIARGRRYLGMVVKPAYQIHVGPMVQRSWWGDIKYNGTGRVMIDFVSFRQNNPNYEEYFGEITPSGSIDDEDTIPMEEITDQHLLCMSPYVYGFSFVSKQWGEMLIDNLSPVQFRTDAYDKLVLDPESKEMILALVDSDFTKSKDFVDGKGGGCIFLLAGPPGCGKTLTAEAIAERLERPLYMIGIGELGTNVDALEKQLTKVLNTAAAWNAVLLLDEADIFLEARSDLDIHRNAMVGVFLRLLEYYPGILFLTSNRAKRLDPAFYSRISLALQYHNLDKSARKIVWRNILDLHGLNGDIDVDLLAEAQINGRQIKNVANIATKLCQAGNRKPTTRDFDQVIQRVKAFQTSD